MKTFVPIEFEDLGIPAEDLKIIADGAAIFLRPQPDENDDERLLDAPAD